MKLSKYPTSDSIPDKIKKFCIQQYGFAASFKKVRIRCHGTYYLTEYGHLIRFRGNNPCGYLVSGNISKPKKPHRRKSWPVVQFYDESGERIKIISLAKLMLMTFKGWSEKKARSVSIFPKDGDNRNLHIDNLIGFDNAMIGQTQTYGSPIEKIKRLSRMEVYNIRRSNKTNKELADKYDRAIHTISRIRNYRSFRDY